jgi:hypothetical protein
MKKLITPILLAGFLLGAVVAPAVPAQDAPQKKEAAPRVFIPKEVKDVLQGGLQSRQARQDIPFTIFKSTFLPAQQAFYIIFFTKMKNADLGFAPAAVSQVADAAATPKIRAVFDVFLEFHKMENGAAGAIVKEVYVPVALEQDAAGFDANKEEWYSVGYPLMPGDYLLAMAVTTHDLKKIGTQYYEFSLPDAKTFTKELGTTPVFFVKDLKNVGAAEQRSSLHKGLFRYSVLEIVPNIEQTFTAGDALDVFFTVFGAQPNAQNKYELECQYEVKKGEEAAIKFQPATYDAPLISHPLPLKQTVQIKTGDNVRTESRDLAPGNYTLHITMKDKVSGLSGTKTVDFFVK